MILSHFTDKPFTFDPTRKYMQGIPETRLPFKPVGFWLSDETEFGWKKWCEDAEFRLETLIVRKDFKVDLSNVVLLDTQKKIRSFADRYIIRNATGLEACDWKRVVSEQYKGIIISPYCLDLRFEAGFMWYYTWDCASGCFWDLSCLTEIVESNASCIQDDLKSADDLDA